MIFYLERLAPEPLERQSPARSVSRMAARRGASRSWTRGENFIPSDPRTDGPIRAEPQLHWVRSAFGSEWQDSQRSYTAIPKKEVIRLAIDSASLRCYRKQLALRGVTITNGCRCASRSSKASSFSADLVRMSVNPTSSSSHSNQVIHASQPAARQAENQQRSALPQDKVTLSHVVQQGSASQKSSGDVDHGGDSH